MKKRWLGAALAAAVIFAVAVLFGYLFLAKRGPVLTVATWAGTYERAQHSALVAPFSRATGADVRVAEYDGGTDELAHQVASKSYSWDVIDLELPDAVAACDEGLLEPLNPSMLPAGADGVPASRDFVAGAIGRCWIGSVVYSQVMGFDPHRFSGAQPSRLQDFFDTRAFPGPRALSRTSPKLNLELALLADGVPPSSVYDTLSRPEGVARALAKLDALGSDLVWSSPSDSPAQMIAQGRAAFATIRNWAVFDAATQGTRLGVIWDRQLYELEVFGVPRGDPKKAMALDFIRYSTDAKGLAGVASWIPYGPARRSALPLVGRNPDLKIAMTPFLPTTPDHFATAFAVDDGWWRLHGADIDALWQAWLAKKK